MGAFVVFVVLLVVFSYQSAGNMTRIQASQRHPTPTPMYTVGAFSATGYRTIVTVTAPIMRPSNSNILRYPVVIAQPMQALGVFLFA